MNRSDFLKTLLNFLQYISRFKKMNGKFKCVQGVIYLIVIIPSRHVATEKIVLLSDGLL